MGEITAAGRSSDCICSHEYDIAETHINCSVYSSLWIQLQSCYISDGRKEARWGVSPHLTFLGKYNYCDYELWEILIFPNQVSVFLHIMKQEPNSLVLLCSYHALPVIHLFRVRWKCHRNWMSKRSALLSCRSLESSQTNKPRQEKSLSIYLFNTNKVWTLIKSEIILTNTW